VQFRLAQSEGSGEVGPANGGCAQILRTLAIVVLPVVGTVVIFGSSSGMETAIGCALILLALGLVATWFWQPW
jgi:hypothetical protein